MATVLSSHTAVDIDFFLGQELAASCIWAVDLLVKSGGKICLSLNQLRMKFLDNFFSAANLTTASPSSKFHVWRESRELAWWERNK